MPKTLAQVLQQNQELRRQVMRETKPEFDAYQETLLSLDDDKIVKARLALEIAELKTAAKLLERIRSK